jgi:hypothetical protein
MRMATWPVIPFTFPVPHDDNSGFSCPILSIMKRTEPPPASTTVCDQTERKTRTLEVIVGDVEALPDARCSGLPNCCSTRPARKKWLLWMNKTPGSECFECPVCCSTPIDRPVLAAATHTHRARLSAVMYVGPSACSPRVPIRLLDTVRVLELSTEGI